MSCTSKLYVCLLWSMIFAFHVIWRLENTIFVIIQLLMSLSALVFGSPVYTDETSTGRYGSTTHHATGEWGDEHVRS